MRTLIAGALMTMAGVASGQPVHGTSASSATLRVHLECDTCDTEFIAENIAFVEFDTDPDRADVKVVARPTLSDQRWRLSFSGQRRFSGRDRVLHVALPVGAADTRRELARLLRLGLLEYAADTAAGPLLDVTVRPARPASSTTIVDIEGAALDVTVRQGPTGPSPVRSLDRWQSWVFHLNLEADGAGEQSVFDHTHHVSAAAHRTTAGWKLRFGGSRSLSRSSFTLDDETTVKSRLTDWSVDALAVRSAGRHLAMAWSGALTSSTYSNEQRVARVGAGIEYDVFPYDQSTRRSLTLQYMVGRARHEYAAETIFGVLADDVAEHAVDVSLGLRQPWGQVGSTFLFRQHLAQPDRSRMTFVANLNVRLTSHVSLSSSGSYSRIRDQFTLPRGEATEEDVLLRQRQLATGYRYAMTVGLSFSFGALSNATVNPRFNR